MGVAQLAEPPISLRYLMPAIDLRTYISAYYVFRADLPFVTDIMRADLPQLRFMIRGHGFYSFSDGVPVATPDVALIGPTMSSYRFDVTGPILVFGIALMPAGWAALMREDASALADSVIDATELLGPLVIDALDAMRFRPTVDNLALIIDVVIRSTLNRAAEPPLWFTRMTDNWLIGDRSPQVGQLIFDSAMSARQIERLARRIYGAPPKLLARKYRALRAASLLASNGDWLEAAGDAFYDQSHFIREFKQFTGLTPKRFQHDLPPVTRLSIGRRQLAGQLPTLALLS